MANRGGGGDSDTYGGPATPGTWYDANGNVIDSTGMPVSGGGAGGGGFDWMSLLGAGAGLGVSSLFGGGGGHGGDRYRGSEEDDLRKLSGVGDDYNQFAHANLKSYYQRKQQSDDAITAMAKYLNEDPNTDQHDASWLNQALAGSGSAYQGAAAQMAARNSASGLTSADNGPGSSTAAGQNAYLAAMQGNSVANAQNALAQQKIATRRSNMGDLVSLLSGAQNTAGAGAMQGLGGETGIYDDLASRYGSLADYMDKRKAGEDAQRSQQIGQFASMIPTLFA